MKATFKYNLNELEVAVTEYHQRKVHFPKDRYDISVSLQLDGFIIEARERCDQTKSFKGWVRSLFARKELNVLNRLRQEL